MLRESESFLPVQRLENPLRSSPGGFRIPLPSFEELAVKVDRPTLRG